MLPETLEEIIQERIRKIESKPNGSSEKEYNLEGIRLLNKACEELNNPKIDGKETDQLIIRGLTLAYYEQQHKHNKV